MSKEKASRNKTIGTPVSDGETYIARCIKLDHTVSNINAILYKTVLPVGGTAA